jgi:quercetin dioxygenase-like cupin family protein
MTTASPQTPAKPQEQTAAKPPAKSARLLVRRAEEMEGTPMQMEGVKGVSMRMMVGRADGAPNFSMRHFTVEPGGNTPRHSHNYEHEICILEGAARVEYDGSFENVAAGDVLFIEPNKVHQLVNAGAAALKFLCLVPVSFDCGKPTPGS